MGKLRVQKSRTNPLILVEWIIAISTLIGGAYVLSPVLELDFDLYRESPIIQALGSSLGLFLFGLAFTLSGILIIAGIVRKKVRWRATGLFLNGLGRLYIIIAGFAVTGLLPLTWLSNATLMAIAFFIWGRIRWYGIE